MPNAIYPDRSNVGFDINYHQLKVLPSDVKSRLFNQGQQSGGDISQPQTGGSGGDDTPNPPGGSGCKLVYVANMNQSGTNDPVATVFENTIGEIVWTRAGGGDYYGTLAGKFPEGKTWLIIGKNKDGDDLTNFDYSFRRVDVNRVLLQTAQGGALDDTLMFDLSIEIRTYCTNVCRDVQQVEFTPDDAAVGLPYLFTVPLTGSVPFTRTIIAKPSWMDVDIVGSNLVLSGTPDTSGTFDITLHIDNCSGPGIDIGTAVVVDDPGTFTMEYDHTTTEANKLISLVIGGFSMTGFVDWGDGTTEHFDHPGTWTAEHTYVTAGDYNVIFYFDSDHTTAFITNYTGSQIRGFTHENSMSFLHTVELFGVMDTTGVVLPVSSQVQTLQLIGHVASSQTAINCSGYNSNLKTLDIEEFPLVDEILNVPSTITQLISFNNNPSLTNIDNTHTMPPALGYHFTGNANGIGYDSFDLSACVNFTFSQDLSVSTVNALLVQLDANGISNGSCYLIQSPAAVPTGAGATAKANLISKGWTVNTN